MTSRHVRVLVPPPVPVPRAALWIALLLDLARPLRSKHTVDTPAPRPAAVQRYVAEGGK